jgi:hypothetical protein
MRGDDNSQEGIFSYISPAAALAYRDQQRSISVFRTIDSEGIIGLF